MSHRITTTTAALASRAVKITVACGLLVGLAACDTYLSRRDTVSLGAGNAVRGNIALHTDDFWPRQSFDRNVPHQGTRAVTSIRAYDQRTATGTRTPSAGTTN